MSAQIITQIMIAHNNEALPSYVVKRASILRPPNLGQINVFGSLDGGDS